MDYLTCEVRLGGNVQNTVIRNNVTPAEVEVLKAAHGADAIVNIVLTHSDDTEISPASAREALATKYGRVVHELYPGARPTLPSTAQEIGVVPEEDRPKAVHKAVSAAKKLTPVTTARLDANT